MGFIAAILFMGTILLFARATGNDFVNYDDPDYVTANLHVRAGLSLETVRWAMTAAEASNWHPLTWLSHALDVTLFGLDPRGHHATSVLLHALNAVVAFLAMRRLTGALWTSAFFAALFAWHPLRVESVAWVAERKDLLSINGKILVGQGQAIERRASGDVRILVVGNPCNTNCLIAMNNARSIPAERWHAMTRLDENRAKSALAEKAGHEVVAGDMDVHCCAGHLARNPRRAGRLIPHGGRSPIIDRWTQSPIPPFASSSMQKGPPIPLALEQGLGLSIDTEPKMPLCSAS